MKGRCFIHAGTHKTGTTSLQDALTRNAAAFADAGVLIARTGRPVALAGSEFVANANLAWQIVSDPRFDPAAGTLADLTIELAESPHATAVVSAEDFALAFDRPGALEALRDACIAADYRPTAIVYLREQGSYAQSLYGMFVVRGQLPLAFEEFAAQIFRDATIGWGPFRFPFEYEHLLAPFTAAFGSGDLIVRPYRAGRSNAELVREFVALFGIAGPLNVEALVSSQRLNEGSSFLTVMNALHRNYARTRDGLPDATAIALEESLPLSALEAPFEPVGPAGAELFRRRFATSNAVIGERFGVEIEQRYPKNSLDRDIQEAFLGACNAAWRPVTAI